MPTTTKPEPTPEPTPITEVVPTPVETVEVKPEPTPVKVVEDKTEPQQRPPVTKVVTESYMYAGQIYPASEREPEVYMVPAELADGIDGYKANQKQQSRQADIFAKPVRQQ